MQVLVNEADLFLSFSLLLRGFFFFFCGWHMEILQSRDPIRAAAATYTRSITHGATGRTPSMIPFYVTVPAPKQEN